MGIALLALGLVACVGLLSGCQSSSSASDTSSTPKKSGSEKPSTSQKETNTSTSSGPEPVSGPDVTTSGPSDTSGDAVYDPQEVERDFTSDFCAPFVRDLYQGCPILYDANANKFDIGVLQQMLKFVGQQVGDSMMSAVEPDGDFGASTANAVEAYQKLVGLDKDSAVELKKFCAKTSYQLDADVKGFGGLPTVPCKREVDLMTDYNHAGESRTEDDITAIIVHWTGSGSKGSDVYSNRNYHANNTDYVSSHYYTDDKTILQGVDELRVANHCKGANNYAIGIEMCANADGNWFQTENNTITLVREIQERYGIKRTQIKFHNEITGSTACAHPYNSLGGYQGRAEYWTSFKNRCKP